jgi:UDP-GlcNAc:undecaprenyl-phosphate GlcNAc-1-phosphate transferase
VSDLGVVILAGAAAFVASLLVTPAAAALAVRWQVVALPSQRGVHVNPTPLLGGIAVVLGIVVGSCVGAHPLDDAAVTWTLAMVVLATVLGIVDDRIDLRWHTKLVFQIVAAALYVALTDPLPGLGALGPASGLLWLVVMMNAVNLIDNSNGLASGTASLASAVLGVLALLADQPHVAALAFAVCGAAGGFFIHNFPRGAIFLGDGGSLPLGFVLGALSLQIAGDRPASSAISLALPIAYPVFDLAFVVISRWRRGEPIVTGGTDHTVHHLAKRLRSLRVAVVLLLGVTAVLGAACVAMELA